MFRLERLHFCLCMFLLWKTKKYEYNSIVASDVPGGNQIRRIQIKARRNALRIAISKIEWKIYLLERHVSS